MDAPQRQDCGVRLDLEALLQVFAGPVTDSMGVFSMEHLPDRLPKFVAAESDYLIHPCPGSVRKKRLGRLKLRRLMTHAIMATQQKGSRS